MKLWQTLNSALTKKSRYKGNWLPELRTPLLQDRLTRQQRRAAARRIAFAAVTRRNPGMSRAERRMLARAYAVTIAWNPKEAAA